MAALLIHRNPQCARCARIVRMHHRLDWFGRIQDTTQPPEDAPAPRMGEILVRDLQTGALLDGVDAVRAIARAVPLYLPLRLLLRIPAIARRADADARGQLLACAPDRRDGCGS